MVCHHNDYPRQRRPTLLAAFGGFAGGPQYKPGGPSPPDPRASGTSRQFDVCLGGLLSSSELHSPNTWTPRFRYLPAVSTSVWRGLLSSSELPSPERLDRHGSG